MFGSLAAMIGISHRWRGRMVKSPYAERERGAMIFACPERIV